MPIPSNLTTQDLDYLQGLANQGKVAEAWQYLAQRGDTYADDAHQVVAQPDSTFGQLVKIHWENTAGSEAYRQYFDDVSQSHLQNYLQAIQAIRDNSGAWPDTQQIEQSYRNAVESYGLPAITGMARWGHSTFSGPPPSAAARAAAGSPPTPGAGPCA